MHRLNHFQYFEGQSNNLINLNLCIPILTFFTTLITNHLIADGKTYSNECTLKQKSCDSPKKISVAYQGACGTVEIKSNEGNFFSRSSFEV